MANMGTTMPMDQHNGNDPRGNVEQPEITHHPIQYGSQPYYAYPDANETGHMVDQSAVTYYPVQHHNTQPDYSHLDSKDPAFTNYSTETAYNPNQSGTYPYNDTGLYGHGQDSNGLEQDFDGVATEKRKPILSLGLGVLRFAIHIFCIAATVSIVQLSFRYQYASDAGKWKQQGWALGLDVEETQNILQFAAKIYDIFVGASTALIILSVIRRRLLSRRGIPLGLLVGGYDLTPLYLISGSFWGPVVYSVKRRRASIMILAIAIGLTIVYINVVGPCAAVLMIPSLGWWDIPDPYAGRPLTAYFGISPAEVWPMALEYNSTLAFCYSGNYTSGCPAGGGGELREWARTHAKQNMTPAVTLNQRYSSATREVKSVRSVTQPTVYVGTALHASIGELAGLFWNFVSSTETNRTGTVDDAERPKFTLAGDSSVLSPIVQVQCKAVDHLSVRLGQANLTYPTWFTDDVEVAIPLTSLKSSYPSGDVSVTWMNVTNVSNNGGTVRASIGALVSVPYARSWSNTTTGALLYNTQHIALTSCLIDARWVSVDVSFDPSLIVMVQNNLTDFHIDQVINVPRGTEQAGKYGLSERVSMTNGWAALLNPPDIWTEDADANLHKTHSLEAIFTKYLKSSSTQQLRSLSNTTGLATGNSFNGTWWNFAPPDYGNGSSISDKLERMSEVVSTVLSLAVADGMARSTHYITPYMVVIDEKYSATQKQAANLLRQAGEKTLAYAYPDRTWLASGQTTNFQFNVQRWGYGFGTNSKTVQFSIVILFIHTFLATAYIVLETVHWFRRRWSTTAWESIGELVALSLMTRQPPRLKNAGAGVDNWDTWKVNVSVRTTYDDTAELVVKSKDSGPDSDISRKLAPGKLYG